MSGAWIPYGRQSIDESDIAAVEAALRSGWLTTGPTVEAFEADLEKVTGAPTFVVSSGTAALHCAYAGAGIGPGDHVIVPAITFVATAATAIMLGAEVSIVDVSPDTLNIDPSAAESAIKDNTRAIVAVDYAGHPADLDALRDLCDRNELILIEDASHSLGARLNERPIGAIADLTTFSFHPVKPITTGEGGAVSGLRDDLLSSAKRFRNHGLRKNPTEFILSESGGWHREIHEFGLNYRMPDFNAALGISQLRRLDSFLEKRRQLARRYSEELADIDRLTLPISRRQANSGWHLFPIRVASGMRRTVYDRLQAAGIGVQVHYLPIHLHPVFQALGYAPGMLRNAEEAYDELLSLPMFPDLDEGDVARVIEEVRRAVG